MPLLDPARGPALGPRLTRQHSTILLQPHLFPWSEVCMAKITCPPKTQTFPFLDHHWVPETLRIYCLNSPQTASRTSMVFFPRSVLQSTGCTTRMFCPRPDGSIERDYLWSLWVECGHIPRDVFSVWACFWGLLQCRNMWVWEEKEMGPETGPVLPVLTHCSVELHGVQEA